MQKACTRLLSIRRITNPIPIPIPSFVFVTHSSPYPFQPRCSPPCRFASNSSTLNQSGHTSTSTSTSSSTFTSSSTTTSTSTNSDSNTIYLTRFLTKAGVCSRDKAPRALADGRCTVNNRHITDNIRVDVTRDVICVDGKRVHMEEKSRMWIYHKRVGELVSHSTSDSRPSVFTVLRTTYPELPDKIISVGRLDVNSCGLLLITNQGPIARCLEHPSNGWIRVYRVRAAGNFTRATHDTLSSPLTIDGVEYRPMQVERIRKEEHPDQQGRLNSWYTVTVHEGKKREIRRIFAHVGLIVNRLIRVSYGPYHLDNIEPGEIREVDIHPEVMELMQKMEKKGDIHEIETETDDASNTYSSTSQSSSHLNPARSSHRRSDSPPTPHSRLSRRKLQR